MTSTTKNAKHSVKPVWFITGCSTGFGQQIAKHVLDLAGRPVAVDKGAKEGSANMEWMMAHKPFLHRALNWLQAEQPIIIGKKFKGEVFEMNRLLFSVHATAPFDRR